MPMEGKFGSRAEINSETPEEIAVSIVAELIKVRGETPRHWGRRVWPIFVSCIFTQNQIKFERDGKN